MCHTIPEQTKRIPVSCVDVRHVQVLNCGSMQSSMFPQQYKIRRKGWPDRSCHAYLARCHPLLVQSCKATPVVLKCMGKVWRESTLHR